LDIIGDNNNSQIKFWSSGAVALQNYTAFKDNELVTKKYVDDKVASGGDTAFPPLPEYDYYYLDMEGTSPGRITFEDYYGNRTKVLKDVKVITFHAVDSNGKRWTRDKDSVSHQKFFGGVINILNEEGKTILTGSASGKASGHAELHYFNDEGFNPQDAYCMVLTNSECVTVTSDVKEVEYPQKLYVHVTGLHF
jgi:hypothetical protein